MKDRFSERSADYAVYRPVYPAELIEFILSEVKSREAYWDVGTGSGQLLGLLAPHFKRVLGTDSSESQLSFAPQLSNVVYKTCRAEEDPLFDQQFDLITVAQAIHWFNFEAFYTLVNRYLHADGLFVVTGYGLISIDVRLDELVREIYAGVLDEWWDPERRFVDEDYRTLPFPFEEIACPAFTIRAQWSRDHLEGYIRTWSAYRLYIGAGHPDPVPGWMEKVKECWPAGETKEIRFPVLLRAGRKKR